MAVVYVHSGTLVNHYEGWNSVIFDSEPRESYVKHNKPETVS